MPNPLPSDQRRFAAESPFDAAFGYGSAPDIYADVGGTA